MIPAPDLYQEIADKIATQGYAVTTDFLLDNEVDTLVEEAIALRDAGELHRAAVGKGAETSVNDDLRGDFIHWIEADSATPAQRAYLSKLDCLRGELNRSLFLGLFDFEGHVAIYPPGGFYRKHLDRFQSDDRRTLTSVLYLNRNWQDGDGGKLRMYLDENGEGETLDIDPKGGTLVTFLSGRYWHEVLTANKERISITGWFRTRGEGLL